MKKIVTAGRFGKAAGKKYCGPPPLAQGFRQQSRDTLFLGGLGYWRGGGEGGRTGGLEGLGLRAGAGGLGLGDGAGGLDGWRAGELETGGRRLEAGGWRPGLKGLRLGWGNEEWKMGAAAAGEWPGLEAGMGMGSGDGAPVRAQSPEAAAWASALLSRADGWALMGRRPRRQSPPQSSRFGRLKNDGHGQAALKPPGPPGRPWERRGEFFRTFARGAPGAWRRAL
jgi:hypothetical protein